MTPPAASAAASAILELASSPRALLMRAAARRPSSRGAATMSARTARASRSHVPREPGREVGGGPGSWASPPRRGGTGGGGTVWSSSSSSTSTATMAMAMATAAAGAPWLRRTDVSGRGAFASATFSTAWAAAPIDTDDSADGGGDDEMYDDGPPRSTTPSSSSSSEGGEGADSSFAWDPRGVLAELRSASRWVRSRKDWDPQLCRSAAGNYERHLRRHVRRQRHRYQSTPPTDPACEQRPGGGDDLDSIDVLLSPETARLAVKTLLKSNLPTGRLRGAVRDLERLVGSVTHPSPIPLTDDLSYQLLEANAKSGSIGRTLALLEHRTSRGYRPRGRNGRWEYRLAIMSILSAGVDLRKFRNPYEFDAEQPMIDNPTRWLDAILVNMHERGVELDTILANRMLMTYASTGRSGRAVHFFYRLEGPKDPAAAAAAVADGGATDDPSGDDDFDDSSDGGGAKKTPGGGAGIRMHMRHPPHFYKLPSRSSTLADGAGPGPGGNNRRSKLARESGRDWSLPLTSAFAFADSLTHGACGHPPIELDVFSYNTLIKACCHRGALWRAIHLLRVKMPELGLTPNTYSYNIILHGLARVGDRAYLQEFLVEMTNEGVPLDKYSVQAFVLGLLNVGDVGGAVTLIQDVFNQHNAVLPPYTSHLDVIEVALANGLTYEARRHVYFLEQVRRWERPDFVDEERGEAVYAQARHPKLSREALVRIFEYHGEELTDDDFF